MSGGVRISDERYFRTFRRLSRGWLLKFLALLCAGGVLGSALIYPLEAQAVTSPLKIFPLPSAPFDVKVGGNRVWFTLPEANQVGSLEVISSGSIVQHLYTFYSLPSSDSYPYRLAVDSNDVWFTQKRGNRIGRLSISSGVITEYAVPTSDSEPAGIDIAPDGRVWFVESKGDKLAVLTPSSGTIQEIDVGYDGAELDRVNATSASFVWMTAPGVRRVIGRRLAFNDFVSLRVMNEEEEVRGLSVTNSEAPWISTKNPSGVASYLVGTLSMWIWQPYALKSADLVEIRLWTPSGKTLLWALDSFHKEVVLIDAETMRLFHQVKLGTNESRLTSLAFDPMTEVVWIADAGRPALYALEPPYMLRVHLPWIAR